jgi:hypothetical protein
VSIIIDTYMRYQLSNTCVLHARRKVWVRNLTVDGVLMGEYHCPVERCESVPDFGEVGQDSIAHDLE